EAARAVPIRSCSRWGLPCRRRCRRRGALLPHRFTLAAAITQRTAAVCFLWHFPWNLIAACAATGPAGRYPAPYVHGARTFLPGALSVRAGPPARPPDAKAMVTRSPGAKAPRLLAVTYAAARAHRRIATVHR